MSHECTEERFLRDVADHKMIVIRDDGVDRHIRFKKPNSGEMRFDLITWPGHLCYTGDMGTYVFQRTEDMFNFFRADREYNRQRGRRLAINTGYWTEKLIAVHGGRDGGKAMEYDEAAFRRVINQYRMRWMRSAKEEGLLDEDGRRALWEAVDDEVFGALADGGVDRALWAAREFSYQDHESGGARDSWYFEELWEHRFKNYTFGMVWCLYALAWGIEQYDAAKHPAAVAVPA